MATTTSENKGGQAYVVTLRQEILNTAGVSIKSFYAMQYAAGKTDLQMYWFRNADGSSMNINRNNILSIVSTQNFKDADTQVSV